jgi:hypothetical protein
MKFENNGGGVHDDDIAAFAAAADGRGGEDYYDVHDDHGVHVIGKRMAGKDDRSVHDDGRGSESPPPSPLKKYNNRYNIMLITIIYNLRITAAAASAKTTSGVRVGGRRAGGDVYV